MDIYGGWLSVVEVVEIFLEKLRELELVRKRRKEEEEGVLSFGNSCNLVSFDFNWFIFLFLLVYD